MMVKMNTTIDTTVAKVVGIMPQVVDLESRTFCSCRITTKKGGKITNHI